MQDFWSKISYNCIIFGPMKVFLKKTISTFITYIDSSEKMLE